MRTAGPLLLALLSATPALAEPCAHPPAAESSASRAISDVPYAPTAAPCPAAQAPVGASGFDGRSGWDSDTNQTRQGVVRAGLIGVALGSLLLVTGGSFALCAKNSTGPGSRAFCHDATAPTLIAGGSAAVLGIGALAVATWVIPEQTASGKTASVSAGFKLRWAF
jgi:hypothetical protein